MFCDVLKIRQVESTIFPRYISAAYFDLVLHLTMSFNERILRLENK